MVKNGAGYGEELLSQYPLLVGALTGKGLRLCLVIFPIWGFLANMNQVTQVCCETPIHFWDLPSLGNPNTARAM